ncbi:aldose 1-epimerase family protein [Neobacillus muris]|uniref:aldose 1-epimerase family protein n=1 Tax=Neobacillus muris TaxID=2941334 RepID=UPI00203CA334|nr:aldose 1-epimerase family protein [Neobacillus muris]
MKLYGKDWTRREIEKYVGRLEQIGGLRKMKYQEGPEAGVEMIQVRTGGGLSLAISPSRGMDISLAEFMGVPISWQSANGDIHPAYYDARGGEWARTAVGGLLMTCGLTQVGTATFDNGEELGLHGRVHHIAAKGITAEGVWINDQYRMKVKGVVEETTAFGEYLRLIREYTFFLGENTIYLKDTVENIGFTSRPHMILYHFNFGFPFINEETGFTFPSNKITPRDEGIPIEGYDEWGYPRVGYQERVYYHENLNTYEEDNGKEYANVIVSNPRFPNPFDQTSFPLSMKLSWDVSNLPRFTQWKMNGAGTNVVGIEPGNCYVEGRKVEKERGSLVMLEPGQSLTYDLKIEFF